MDFLSIPDGVVLKNILPLLHANDLLRLRRVCKRTKFLADDYIRIYSKSKHYIVISMEEGGNGAANGAKSLHKFLQEGKDVAQGSTRFHIQNTSAQDLAIRNKHIEKFVALYGSKITHLKINQLNIPFISADLIPFFEALPNLAHLSIGKMLEAGKNDVIDFAIPETFRKLKSFKIGTYATSGFTESSARFSVKKLWYLFDNSSDNLLSVYHPNIKSRWQKLGGRRSDPGVPFQSIIKLIESREKAPTEEISQLGYVDLKGYKEDGTYSSSQEFYQLLTACARNGIKIMNVNANLMQGVIGMEGVHDTVELLNCTVMSLKGLVYKAFALDFPNLEKVWIEERKEKDYFGIYGQEQQKKPTFQRPLWPNLAELKLVVGNTFLIGSDGQGIFTKQALEYFFVGIKREKMETLDLSFGRDFLTYQEANPKITFPKAVDVVSSCGGNLKSLTLTNWPGTNKMIAQLWEGLHMLEMVELGDCENLGNVAFVGEDIENPIFLKLKRLQQLALKGLAKMPKITDTLFKVVLRNMPLKRLYLTSHCNEKRVKKGGAIDSKENAKSIDVFPSITASGIESLLSGEFAVKIEVFPLWKNLRLKGATHTEMKELEAKFRSSQM